MNKGKITRSHAAAVTIPEGLPSIGNSGSSLSRFIPPFRRWNLTWLISSLGASATGTIAARVATQQMQHPLQAFEYSGVSVSTFIFNKATMACNWLETNRMLPGSRTRFSQVVFESSVVSLAGPPNGARLV